MLLCAKPVMPQLKMLFFSNADDFDKDPNCFSPLSCEAVSNSVRRILPEEVKMNSIHKQRFHQ